MLRGTFLDCCYQCPCPCDEPLPIHASAGDPPTLSGSFGSVSYKVTAPFFWVLVWARFCLWLPRLESLFPPVLWKSYNQILLAFKVRFLGNCQSHFWIPQLGSLTWGSEPSQQWENFFDTLILQFVGHSPGGSEIWFYGECVPPIISLKLLLCLWTGGIFFLVGSSTLLSMVVQ